MQSTQTTQTISPVHVKVALDNEFRRFLLNPISFDHLEKTLKTLFSLQSEFRIKFQDDENDWVLITTDQELVYATELSGSPLRLQVKLLSSDTPAKADAESLSATERGRGRGCRGRGRGAGRGGLKSREERLSNKSSRLAERINQLETKLSSPKLTSERERVIRWRLAKLKEKLALITAVKESLANSDGAPAESTDPVAEVVTPNEEEEEKPSCRGGRRGRGCRGGWRRAMEEEGSDQPRGCKGRRARIAPELIANFRQCKANLQAARESGNAEEINSCLEAFRVAKAAKWEARAALRAQEASTDDEQKA
jgi:hypothetical protein